MYEVNCYLVWDELSGDGLIIDPGDEDELISERIEALAFKPRAILLTHGHGDHIGAVKALKERYRVPFYIGRDDNPMLASPTDNLSALVGRDLVCPPADHLLDDGQAVTIGPLKFIVSHTPGHTPGGVCYLAGKHLFCGDTLFKGSIGRTDLPGGSHEQLLDAIDRKLLTLPDEIICYPGHGPVTSIGEERRSNPFLSGRRFV